MEYVVHKTNLKKVLVDEIVTGEIFLIDKADLYKTKTNKDYYDLTVSNKWGKFNLKIWEPHDVILENEFLEIFLKGVRHNKWGDQWKVTHYLKTDYAGDKYFIKSDDIEDIKDFVTTISSLKFKSSTCQSLYTKFLENFTKDSGEQFHCPSSKRYFNKKYGFIKYLYTLLETSKGYPQIDNDLYLVSCLYHHLGSVQAYECTNDRYLVNEDYNLFGIKNLSLNLLVESKAACLKENKAIDPLEFKIIYNICSEAYGDNFSSMEAAVLISNIRLTKDLEKISTKINRPEILVFDKGNFYINCKELPRGKEKNRC